MKGLKLWTAAAVLVAVSAVSFCAGRNYEHKYYGQKVYDDACRMSDLIRCYSDHIKADSIQDWGCFDKLQGVFLLDDALGSVVRVEDYAYCY